MRNIRRWILVRVRKCLIYIILIFIALVKEKFVNVRRCKFTAEKYWKIFRAYCGKRGLCIAVRPSHLQCYSDWHAKRKRCMTSRWVISTFVGRTLSKYYISIVRMVNGSWLPRSVPSWLLLNLERVRVVAGKCQFEMKNSWQSQILTSKHLFYYILLAGIRLYNCLLEAETSSLG